MSVCLSNSLLPESQGSRQRFCSLLLQWMCLSSSQSAVTVDVPVILAVCCYSGCACHPRSLSHLLPVFHNYYQTRCVYMSSRRYRTSRVSLSAPHYQTSRVSQSVLESSSVRIPTRRRAITYMALIVRSFPATLSQIHHSYNLSCWNKEL